MKCTLVYLSGHVHALIHANSLYRQLKDHLVGPQQHNVGKRKLFHWDACFLFITLLITKEDSQAGVNA